MGGTVAEKAAEGPAHQRSPRGPDDEEDIVIENWKKHYPEPEEAKDGSHPELKKLYR
jgi:hypothetical protein